LSFDFEFETAFEFELGALDVEHANAKQDANKSASKNGQRRWTSRNEPVVIDRPRSSLRVTNRFTIAP
jgi:hypothetical protein